MNEDKNMDKLLERAHKNCINLKSVTKFEYHKVFLSFVNFILDEMKQTSPLFKKLYSKYAMAGSCFDDLKIGAPNEYDINLLLTLPVDHNEIIVSKYF